MYKEKQKTVYYCARCDKEIKGKGRKEVRFERMIMYPNGETEEANFFDSNRGIYLCPKCLKDFDAFIKNSYPKEQSEKEKMLENKLEEIGEEITRDIENLHEHISIISDYMEIINSRINGSAYKKDEIEEETYKCIRNKVRKFLDEVNE